MREKQLRSLVENVREGSLSRREFVQTMLAWGLTVPIAGHILINAGVAKGQPTHLITSLPSGAAVER